MTSTSDNIFVKIDTREQDFERVKYIEDYLNSRGIKTVREVLPSGDYCAFIEGEEKPVVGFEFKTLPDFLGSMSRIKSQAIELSNYAQHSYILVDFELTDCILNSGLYNKSSLIGMMASLTAHCGCPLILAGVYFAEYMYRLILKHTDGKEVKDIYKPIRPLTLTKDWQINHIMALPNIGEKLAKRILEEFETPLAFYTSSDDALFKLKGLGQERVKLIKEILGR